MATPVVHEQSKLRYVVQQQAVTASALLGDRSQSGRDVRGIVGEPVVVGRETVTAIGDEEDGIIVKRHFPYALHPRGVAAVSNGHRIAGIPGQYGHVFDAYTNRGIAGIVTPIQGRSLVISPIAQVQTRTNGHRPTAWTRVGHRSNPHRLLFLLASRISVSTHCADGVRAMKDCERIGCRTSATSQRLPGTRISESVVALYELCDCPYERSSADVLQQKGSLSSGVIRSRRGQRSSTSAVATRPSLKSYTGRYSKRRTHGSAATQGNVVARVRSSQAHPVGYLEISGSEQHDVRRSAG